MDVKRIKRLCAILCICMIPLVLTACGKELTPEEQIAKAAARTAKAATAGFVGLVLNAFACVPILLGTLKSNNTAQRGTNAVTRFVRKSVTHNRQTRYYAMLTIILMADIIGLVTFWGFHLTKLLAFIPPIGCIVYIIVSMAKSTKDKERIQDARVVTKGALQTTAAVAEGVGAAAGAAGAAAAGMDPRMGAKLGMQAGKIVGNIADEAGKSMQVDGYRDMSLEGAREASHALAEQSTDLLSERRAKEIEMKDNHIAAIADTNLFRAKAMRLGCHEDMSLSEMAQIVLKYAPAASLAEIPKDIPDEDKAVMLLGAFKQQPKAIGQQGGGMACGGSGSS